MFDEIKNNLKKIGLTENEILVYLFLIEHNPSSPAQISLNINIKRTNIYYILNKLLEKGLIEKVKISNKTAYIPQDPYALVQYIDNKKKIAQNTISLIKTIYTRNKNQPKIKFYNGWQQVKNIYLESLKSNEIFGIGSLTKFERIDKTFFKKYNTKIKQRKIIFHDLITTSSEKNAKKIKDLITHLYSYKKIPVDDEDLPTDILIWDDKIALITFSEPIFGSIITNKDLTKTFKTLFYILKKLL